MTSGRPADCKSVHDISLVARAPKEGLAKSKLHNKYLIVDYFGTRQIIFNNNMNRLTVSHMIDKTALPCSNVLIQKTVS